MNNKNCRVSFFNTFIHDRIRYHNLMRENFQHKKQTNATPEIIVIKCLLQPLKTIVIY